MLTPPAIVVSLLATLMLAAAGAVGAWWLRCHSTLSIRNPYPAAVAGAVLLLAAALLGLWLVLAVLVPLCVPWIAAVGAGRRWRLSDLGAGEELRRYELERRWWWQPAVKLPNGERRWIGPQSEIIHERPWPAQIEYVVMTAAGDQGARLPLGEGRHVWVCGGTGAGKTTSARRLLAAPTLAHGAAALLIDQKGDPADERELRKLAAAADRPFILFDPSDPEHTDRWAPLWGRPGDVAARAVEAIKTSEPYYADALRQHINLIVDVLHATDRWPPSFPFLVSAAGERSWDSICAVARGLDGDRYGPLRRRVEDHSSWVSSREGLQALRGGLIRLEVVMGAAWRDVLTPRRTPDGEEVAVQLVQAIRSGAVVMWRTYADDMPDEAAAITILAIADIHAAAGQAGAPWTLSARRVRIGDPHGRRPRHLDPAARTLTPRAGDRHHPVDRRHRRALPTTRAARLPDRQLRRVRRPPPRGPQQPRLAREADGNRLALAAHRPDQRSRLELDRARLTPARTAVSDRR